MRLTPIAFSTLAFPDARLATAVALGRSYGYDGVELRLVDGELIDPGMPPSERAADKRIVGAAGLPVIAVDSSIRLAELRAVRRPSAHRRPPNPPDFERADRIRLQRPGRVPPGR